MNTITIEYNPVSTFATQLISLLRVTKGIKIVESPYDSRYVKKIHKAAQEPMTAVSREELWN